jgi:hypothetical protein
LVGTWVFDNYGEPALWIGCLSLSVVAAALVTALGPGIKERRAALSQTEFSLHG